MFIKAPNFVNALSMTLASSAANLPIIAGCQYVRIAGNEDMFVLFGSTGASTGASTAGVASEYVAKASGGILRSLGSTAGTTAVSVISTAAACTVTASWWTI
jgi:hypothetical protein